MSSNTEIYGESANLSGKILYNSVVDLLRSLYYKQKVDASLQSGCSQLELNNILSAHDSKCAFSGECNRNNYSFATHKHL